MHTQGYTDPLTQVHIYILPTQTYIDVMTNIYKYKNFSFQDLELSGA